MKKGKLSWQTFLMTLLVIILLGCLVYYLEQNKVLEGYQGNVAKFETSSRSTGNPNTDATQAETREDNKKDRASKNKKFGDKNLKKDTLAGSNKKKSGTTGVEKFTNMLSYSPVASQGHEPGCVDNLKPYEKYNCGPIDVNNFFGGLKFKPECCGNPGGSSYSSSVGCACICPEQMRFLNSRGGNNTFPTEF